MKFAAPLAAIALLAAACSQAPGEAEVSADAGAPPNAPATREAQDAAASQPRVALALDQEGLRAINIESGSSALIAFGQPQAQTVAVVTRALGDEPSETGVNSDCGAGPLSFASWDDGLTVWSQDGVFAGWAVNRPGPTTMAGIGVGSSRAEIEDAMVAEFSHGSLGKQFKAGELYGIMRDGRVEHIWAGVSCNFG